MEDKTLGLLGLMRRARAVEVGTDSACDTVHAGKAKLLILAADIADNARRKAENASNGRRVMVLPVHYTRAELGAALGLGRSRRYSDGQHIVEQRLIYRKGRLQGSLEA